MKFLFIIFAGLIMLSSCGNASAPKVIPGAGGGHLYELMEEDSTAIDTPSAP